MDYVTKKELVRTLNYNPNATAQSIDNRVEFAWKNAYREHTPFSLYLHKYGRLDYSREAFEEGKRILLALLETKYVGKELKYIDNMPIYPRKSGKKYFLLDGQTYEYSYHMEKIMTTRFINIARGPNAYKFEVRDEPYICFPMEGQECNHIIDLTPVLHKEMMLPFWIKKMIYFSTYDLITYKDKFVLFKEMLEEGDNYLRPTPFKDAKPTPDLEVIKMLITSYDNI